MNPFSWIWNYFFPKPTLHDRILACYFSRTSSKKREELGSIRFSWMKEK